MMGFLFACFFGGLLGAVILYLLPNWRWLTPLAFIPTTGAVGALVSCLGLAIGFERFFYSAEAGGTGFLGGYFFGGLIGAGVGGWAAWKMIGRRAL